MTTMPAAVPDTHEPGSLTLVQLQALSELRLLPSRILHASRLDQFDPSGHWRGLLAQSTHPAPIHRHWSQAVLKQLAIRDSAQVMPRAAALPVALLPVNQINALAAWLGLQLCASRLRTMISKSELEPLLQLPCRDLVVQARQMGAAVHYPASTQWSAKQIATHYVDLGACAVLHACDSSGPESALYRLLALKLPETTPWPDLPDADLLLHACLEFLNKHSRHDVS